MTIVILDAKGQKLASTTVNASCGTGCRGDFRKRVAFHTSSMQDGTVEVFEASPQSGQPTNVVSMPVTLSP